ncbi:MAG: transcriptional repressor LexA [Proteobacteria bacterium]|nr:transcriptional repressor LexA [Pseudomonadota bacterium]
MTITDRQQQVLDFIAAFQAREGFPPSVREICAHLGLKSPGSLIKHLRALEEEGLLGRSPGKKRAWKLTQAPGPRTIPLVGRIAAGTPIMAVENREDDIPVDPWLFGDEDTFALRVKGDSMIEAHIRDGDLAVIRPQAEAQNGDIAAVLVEGIEPEASLKTIRRSPGRLELHPANPAYEPLVFEGEDIARVRVLGRLVGLIRVGS